jgi:signal transduction histidine kinase
VSSLVGITRPRDANLEAYHAAFRSADAATIIVDVSGRGRLVDASDKFLFFMGLDRAASVSRALSQVFPEYTSDRMLRFAREVHASDTPASMTIEGLDRSDQTARVCLHAAPLSGHFVSMSVAVGGALGRTLRRPPLLNEFGHLAGGMIYIYDIAQKRARYVTSSLSQLLGLPNDTPVDLALVAPLIHPEDKASFARSVEEFGQLADGEVRNFWFRIRRPTDNSWRWLHHNVTTYTRSSEGHVRHVIGCAFDITLPRKALDDLALAANALLHAEESERLRIARELHDSTAQHLVASDLLIAAHLQKHGANDSLSCVRDTLATALREIRTLSFLLHPPRLRDEGLNKTLRTFAEGFANRSGLSCHLNISPHPRLVPAVEAVLFRVCQEAFMNAHRHANAKRVDLRLSWSGGEIILEVEDDGIGVGDLSSIRPGVGIDGMRARLTSLGGEMSIEDTGNGTLLRARVPAEGYFHELRASDGKTGLTTLNDHYV